MFAEGQWQMLKAMLERQGWSQGWPLSIAKQNVSALIGYCPIRSRAMA
ncbi:MAG: hypothetical protein LW834_10270 [Cyanobium sp. 49614_E6]|nr:hypothetical protein [Cyanobium sp. 49614_E6]